MIPNSSPPKPGAKKLLPVTVDAAINAAPPETTEKLTTRVVMNCFHTEILFFVNSFIFSLLYLLCSLVYMVLVNHH